MKKRKFQKTITTNIEAKTAEFRKARTQRTFKLAQYCIANIAAYRVNWKTLAQKRTPIIKNDFWIRANGNFFDAAVLEWCKLFAERDGKHHWSRTFKDKKEWTEGFFNHMGMTSKAFSTELIKIKKYRNKFVAHLDDPIPMNYPLTDFMLKSASYLYDALRTNEKTKMNFIGTYETASEYFNEQFEDYRYEINLRERSQFTS